MKNIKKKFSCQDTSTIKYPLIIVIDKIPEKTKISFFVNIAHPQFMLFNLDNFIDNCLNQYNNT